MPNGKQALDTDTFDVDSDLVKTGYVEGKRHSAMKTYVNDKEAIGAHGKASDNRLDMNGYSDKSGYVDGKGKEGSVVGKDNGKDVESDMNAAKETVVKLDVDDKGEVGAIVGDYKNNGTEEFEKRAGNDLGLVASEDKSDKDNDNTALSNMNDTFESDDSYAREILYKIRNNQTTDGLNELDKQVMELVLEFCKPRPELCNSDARGPLRILLSEVERERYGIPEGAIPTIERPWPAMDPIGQILKPKRFYADSSFYIFSFWLYLCLRFLRKRLEEVLREIDNKPHDAQV